MAVPKKKTSKQKRSSRRAHDALSKVSIAFNATTGSATRSHHMSLKDGFYKGRQVIIKREEAVEEDMQNNA